ncbi:MAG: tRNA (N6-isopentenyl adenosine(37)-C2)-methylthiotransferase MiaB [Calditrichaeota bacterium]|nr:tRNA (N6-isopentenyl adenosine(37)-C2)-methylthiotransferase MiaB [Calditrichota bacterium]MCB9391540.1 tRNA (N6-isopentenyl adenosine(37)-C2)-methylthiotransferase MiaB [Calditrichota bacterium]
MHELITLTSNLREPAREPVACANGNGPRVFIQTYGCQMNVSDSQTIESMLGEAGYRFCGTADEADVVLVNTCMIRETAEVRALGQLANLSSLKKRNPAMVIGILGCVAQAKRREILESHAYVDMVVGPDSYRRLPLLLEERFISAPGAPGLLETTLMREELYDDVLPRHHGGVTAFVTIIRGCDKFCSFCVVPRTRGRERSRPLPSILREVTHLTEQGVRDVMLLGQNVDSYRWDDKDFADCLLAVAELPAVSRVRFMTSHPTDISEKLLRTMGEHEKICPYLHLPVQAGSNRVLREMNRPYTRERYLEIIALARELVPGIALSTDVIVGFPTETEDEFEETFTLMEQVRYDTAFMFKYSERPLTKAAQRMKDDVPEDVKVARLERLISLQQKIARERNEAQLGRQTSVLIEGLAPKDGAMWAGRTPDFRPVVLPKNGESVGELVPVRLESLTGFTFHGAREN